MEAVALINIFDVSGWDSLVAHCEDSNTKKEVDEQVKAHYTINVQDAMKQLEQVGKLLQVAYAGSKGFPGSTDILNLLSRYQDLIKLSSVTSTSFVNIVLQALKHHKIALILTDKKKEDKALAMIQRCAELANRMAIETDVLVEKADELCNLSHVALLKTSDDHVSTVEERKAVLEEQKKYEKELARIQIEIEGLQEQIEIRNKEIKEQGEKIVNENSWGNWFKSFVVPSESQKQTERIASLKAKIGEHEEVKRKDQKAQLVANAELKKQIMQINNSHLEENELQNAINSLDIAVKTLGKVKKIFLNTKIFWSGVRKQCENLSLKGDVTSEMLEADRELFIDEIKTSGYCWLAMGKINRDAAIGIRAVDDGVDSIMENLPSKQEAKNILENVSREVLRDLAIEEKMIGY